jgi:hypothetical protein
MNLEQAINHALERGEFVHLSVHAKGNRFEAVFASASRLGGYSTAEAGDPIVAMVRAITSTPMVRKKTVTVTNSCGLAVEMSEDDPALL